MSRKDAPTLAEQARSSLLEDVQRQNFDYEYPDGLNLKPGSKTHDFLVQELTDMAESARDALDGSITEWRKVDQSLSSYMWADDVDRAVKAQDPRKPVTVVVPMLFASQETFLTYMANAFLKDPIHRLTGRGSKQAKVQTILLERVLSWQHLWFKEALALNTFFRDAVTYGIGFVAPVWSKRMATHPMVQRVDEILAMLMRESGESVNPGDIFFGSESRVIAEGNELVNIDPYNALVDPRASINRFQRSQFFGWVERDNAMNMLREEQDPEAFRFNGKYVRMLAARELGCSRFFEQDDDRNTLYGKPKDLTDHVTPGNTVDTVHFFVHLIPKEYGIGDSDQPQLWKMAMSADSILTECRPMKMWHGMMPVVACGPNTTGYDISPVSHMTASYSMQHTIDWLIKSHMDNVRKAINDMLVFNPAIIEPEDVLNPGPGKVIRVREHAYVDQPLDRYIHQLGVSDVTSNHLTDAAAFISFINRTLGTEDILMGDMSNLPERPTAGGIAHARQGALSRLQYNARKIGMQAMQELAFMEAFNTIQFMSQDVAVSVLGTYEDQIRQEYGVPPREDTIMVSPEAFWSIEPGFSVVPHDGSLPEESDVQAMTSLMQSALAVDGVGAQVFGQLNLVELFFQWARKSGFENVHEFRRAGGDMQTQVMPDEQVQQQVQSGNLIPTEAALS